MEVILSPHTLEPPQDAFGALTGTANLGGFLSQRLFCASFNKEPFLQWEESLLGFSLLQVSLSSCLKAGHMLLYERSIAPGREI